MALKPNERYPGQTVTGSAEYPYGKARNITTIGDGTGTPWEQDVANDLWGFLQQLLVAGIKPPNGVPDQVGASDYFDALRLIIIARRAADAVANATLVFQRDPGDAFYDVAFSPAGGTVGKWLAVGHSADGHGLYADSEDGHFWGAAIMGGLTFYGVAAGTITGAVPGFVVVGTTIGGAGVLYRTPADTIAPATGGTIGGVTALRCVAYSPLLGRFCAAGDGGAIVTTDDGVTIAVQTAASGYTGRFERIVWSALFSRFIASGSGGEIQTSPDGLIWTRRHTGGADFASVIDTNYLACVLPSALGNTSFLRSADGSTWTELVLDAPLPFAHVLFAFGGVLCAIENGSSNVRPAVRFSYDVGATWSTSKVYLRGIADSHIFNNAATDGSRLVITASGSGGSKGAIYASPRIAPTL